MGAGSLVLAWRYRDVHKLLAGAFFVSAGVLFYLWLADVSVTLLGTGFVETSRTSAGQAIVHFVLFLLCLLLAAQQTSGARKRELDAAAREAIAHVVAKQGLDVINDGEQGLSRPRRRHQFDRPTPRRRRSLRAARI